MNLLCFLYNYNNKNFNLSVLLQLKLNSIKIQRTMWEQQQLDFAH